MHSRNKAAYMEKRSQRGLNISFQLFSPACSRFRLRQWQCRRALVWVECIAVNTLDRIRKHRYQRQCATCPIGTVSEKCVAGLTDGRRGYVSLEGQGSPIKPSNTSRTPATLRPLCRWQWDVSCVYRYCSLS